MQQVFCNLEERCRNLWGHGWEIGSPLQLGRFGEFAWARHAPEVQEHFQVTLCGQPFPINRNALPPKPRFLRQRQAGKGLSCLSAPVAWFVPDCGLRGLICAGEGWSQRGLWAGGDVHSGLLRVPAGTSLPVAQSPAACDTQHPPGTPSRHPPRLNWCRSLLSMQLGRAFNISRNRCPLSVLKQIQR